MKSFIKKLSDFDGTNYLRRIVAEIQAGNNGSAGEEWKSNFQPPPSKAIALIRAGFINDQGDPSFDEAKVTENKDEIKSLIQKALDEDRESFNKSMLTTTSQNALDQSQKTYVTNLFKSMVEGYVEKINFEPIEDLKKALYKISGAIASKTNSSFWLNEAYQIASEMIKDIDSFEDKEVEDSNKELIILNLNLLMDWASSGFVGMAPILDKIFVPISDKDGEELKRKKEAFNKKGEKIKKLCEQAHRNQLKKTITAPPAQKPSSKPSAPVTPAAGKGTDPKALVEKMSLVWKGATTSDPFGNLGDAKRDAVVEALEADRIKHGLVENLMGYYYKIKIGGDTLILPRSEIMNNRLPGSKFLFEDSSGNKMNPGQYAVQSLPMVIGADINDVNDLHEGLHIIKGLVEKKQ